ncbi:hypothetical protein D6777_01915 [Candidatus Woesearchaeota archaeon]|nr:MAG: hypothetical protein D6777_01915 [Candidatus Woesearchaeota archaeon]
MVLDMKQRHKLKRFIRNLEKIRGRHTELVSVYIPKGYDINKIINHLMQEQGTAENIKDKTTRTHVIDSLERMIRHLRLYKQTPEHGLAVFAGDASDKEGKPNIQVWSIEPPEPINIRLYRCDQSFVLDPLKEMMDVKEVYGLLVVDRREGNIGYLKGTSIQEVLKLTSGVPGKTRAGGQCLHPDTIISMADGQYVSVVDVQEGDEVVSYNFNLKKFVTSKVKKVWTTKKDKVYSITVGDSTLNCSADHVIFLEDGTELPAEKLREGMMLIDESGAPVKITKIIVEDKVVEMVDMEVEMQNFLADGLVVHNSAQRFARLRQEAAKEFFKRIADAAQKEFLGKKELKGILLGGPGPTKEIFYESGYLNNELKEKILTIQDLSYTGEFGLRELVEKSRDVLAKEAITEEREIVEKFLAKLAKDSNMVTYGKKQVEQALELNAVDTLLISEALDEDYAEKLEEKADSLGAEVKIISLDTAQGVQLKDLGGVAAFLRYPIE